MNRMLWAFATAVTTAGIAAVGLSSPAQAHPHDAEPAHHGAGQEIANGALHGVFDPTTSTACGGDAASYGIETAHHGPDAGAPGNADGCYQVESWPPGSDDQNPAIG